LSALGRGQPPRGGVVVKRTLERAQQQIALGAVGEDEAQAAVHLTGGGFQRFADLCDEERKAIKNEKVPSFNRAAARFDGLGLAHTGFDLRLHALEQGSKGLEVLAGLAIRDLLGSALFGARADMAQDRDVVRAGNIRQLCSQLVDVDGFVLRRGNGRRPGE